MENLIAQAIDVATRANAPDAPSMGLAFHAALQPFGLRASYARAYPMPGFVSETVLARVSPPGWEEAYAREKLGRRNFLVRESRTRSTPFAWSAAPRTDPNDEKMWAVLRDHGFSDGLAVPCHGPDGYLGVVSLAFEDLPGLSPDDRRVIEIAATIVHDRLRDIVATAPPVSRGLLSLRERDCLGFVATGKSDWEISVILSISQYTVHAHVEKAKTKLGARTRAQACVRAVCLGLI